VSKKFLHQHPQFKELIEIVSEEKKITPELIEKDYWIMHALWGLLEQGLALELKGGTSLSKGFDIIHRFSEDLDIKIEPPKDTKVYSGKNQTKDQHIESRREFFENLAQTIVIPEMSVRRDLEYDDPDEMRNAGIRLEYQSLYSTVEGLKDGVLLEVGFDTTQPSIACDVSSWAWGKAAASGVDIQDNRAMKVSCYHPGYTFVEKLQTVLRKFKQYDRGEGLKTNFLRHYYDLYQLLEHQKVKEFIGSDDYYKHKKARFGLLDHDLSNAEAFKLNDPDVFNEFEAQYKSTAVLYFKGQPSLKDILGKINNYVDKL